MLDLANIRKFENLELLAKEMVEGFITGLHRSPYHGFSVEFAEHKLYNFGESTKAIDWKVFAKTDRLYTKQYEEETNLRASILIDSSASMHYPTPNKDKLRFSVYAAAALSMLLTRQRDAVGLISYTDQIDFQSEQKSTKIHLSQLFGKMDELLVSPPKEGPTQTADCLHQIAKKLRKRSLIIIFTDMFQSESSLDDIFSSLQHMKHQKHEILLFHVSDYKTEKEFTFEDRPYKMRDLESGEVMTLQPHQVKEVYKKTMEDFYQKVKLGCGKLKIDFIEVDVHETFDKVLGAYLIKRKKMR
ncbi:MAG: hypothetical protein ACI8QD_001213 [Cyclobacteriaceae bacterium]|jgi:uncharacterized protein (DUF58 family)